MSTFAPDAAPKARLLRKREGLVLGVLSAALAGLLAHHALTLPLPKTLIVAAPRQMRITALHGKSLEVELLKRFRQEHGVDIQLKLTQTPEEALELVQAGRADVGLALGVVPVGHAQGETPVSVNGRLKPIVFGPVYDRQPIYAVDWDEGYQPPEAAAGPLDELLRVASAFSESPREAPALPLDALHLLLPFVSQVRDAAPTTREADYRFVWRKDVPRLDQAMTAFWQDIQADGSLAAMKEGSVVGCLPEDPDPFEMELLRRTLAQNVPALQKTISGAARKWGLDPFLLTAVIHQESHFDPRAVSATGVRGLMQMTGETIQFLGVQDPDDAHEVIAAGARYLDMLRTQFVQMGYGREESMLLALASFNVGQGHVQDAIDLARKDDSALPGWTGVRQALGRLAEENVARRTKHGLCRGFEAVDFVDKVRYFAFAIRGLTLGGSQGNELAGLGLALAG